MARILRGSLGRRLEPGDTVAGLRIVRLVGMGRIYEARDATLPRTVAIKVIRPELAADEGFRARFKREASAVAQLAIYGFGQEDGLLYILMPFVGSDLGALLRARKRLDVATAIDVVRQIVRAPNRRTPICCCRISG